MIAAQGKEFVLVLTEQERAELLSLLEQAVTETHAEARRTEAPAYQEQVHRQEGAFRNLAHKLRQLQPRTSAAPVP
jgi:hypothetical protein